ncbi:MAG: hypothetical protein Q8R24_02550 [Legionellaceae bacterium]|nr:hypothetical protein [Legionellaceae bacterium]
MSKEITQRFKGLVFHNNEDCIFYVKLEECVQPLRNCAHEMAEFIDGLACKSDALNHLKEAYCQLEAMPIQDLYRGIDAIKDDISDVHFYSKENNELIMEQADVVLFFEKQNHFNAEANLLVARAIEIEASR